MLSKQRNKKYPTLLHWIGPVLFCTILFLVLKFVTTGMMEEKIFMEDILMTETDWTVLDRRITLLSGFFSCAVLFLILSVKQSRRTKRLIKEKEQILKEEKEQLIRTLSHDIRTPLTSIISYSEFLMSERDIPKEKQREYLAMILKKSEQMKEMSELLLDGSGRHPERFEDAKLLMEQLAFELEEALEDEFTVELDLDHCDSFPGTFDVLELRRITDNLISNIEKYADRSHPVTFSIRHQGEELVIHQSNHIRSGEFSGESYQVGLNSIRWIAHKYGGRVEVKKDDHFFEITITFTEF